METCAKDAAGASIKASNNANAIFLTIVRVLQRRCVSGSTRGFRSVDEFNVARQKYARNHRMPHLSQFYSHGALRDDPECSRNAWLLVEGCPIVSIAQPISLCRNCLLPPVPLNQHPFPVPVL